MVKISGQYHKFFKWLTWLRNPSVKAIPYFMGMMAKPFFL